MKKLLRILDRRQKSTTAPAVAIATLKKFSEDHSTRMAATIAFWGFFSIFPLLLVAVTLLGWLLPAGERATVLGRVASMFPLLDPRTVKGLTGSDWALILGVATTLWSGLGAVRTVENAFSSVWEIPYHRRPGTLKQVLRAIAALATIGSGLVVATLVSGFVTGADTGVNLGVAGRAGGYVLAAALDVGLLIAAFRMLTIRDVTTREVLPGAILSGIALFILQEASAFIISRHLHSAQSTYANFAVVITILWWFYLESQIVLLGAQLNVVLKDRLYPRSIVDAPQTDADHRVLQAYAAERTYQPQEKVTATVERPAAPESGRSARRPQSSG